MIKRHKHTVKRVITSGVKWMFVAMFALVLILLIQVIKHPDHPPHFFQFQGLTVLSNSMNPTFQTGDLIIVKAMDALDVQKDDVITFKGNDVSFVTHRVIDIVDERGELGFITKGDNNNIADDEIVRDQHLLGKVLFHIPYLGYVAKFMGSKTGFVLLILLPLIGYIGMELNDRLGRNNNKKGAVK